MRTGRWLETKACMTFSYMRFDNFLDSLKKIESYKITGLFLYLWKNMSVISENKKRVWWYAF